MYKPRGKKEKRKKKAKKDTLCIYTNYLEQENKQEKMWKGWQAKKSPGNRL